MGEITKIAWTDSTFNPWIGCTKVTSGCDNCYAAEQDHRWGHQRWGVGAKRELTSNTNWRKPLQWNKRAAMLGKRHRVFCASMADVFDAEVPQEWRERLWALIEVTPHLDWLLLTKRPQNIRKALPADWGTRGWRNVWLGTTVEEQKVAATRIAYLLDVPAPVHFVSAEPLLGPLDLRKLALLKGDGGDLPSVTWDALTGYITGPDEFHTRVDWVIGGGESGQHARPCAVQWLESLRDQCKAAGVAYFNKQLGADAHDFNRSVVGGWEPGDPEPDTSLPLCDKKGGDPAEWPESLRVQEWPTPKENA